MSRPFPRRDLVGDSTVVAPRLLNALVSVSDTDGSVRVGRIVEVEAYRGERDPASHAYRGPTARNATMFGPPGLLYVYRSYGIHWCANVVAGVDGVAEAVLIRAVEPVAGLERMRGDRPGIARDVDLANGPGKLCAALAITGADDGVDLCGRRSRIRLVRDDVGPPARPVRTTRVGITRGVEHRWRFLVPGHPGVSRGRPSGGGS
ncbi:MAG TPA: DNA-3-methyladenine glycosylase [Microthrixaceae bacterium]|nr:DNA-3-methyladenine glycosylase [Microthrixaceae bacterium]RTL05722.1 MAG: DNA-3-methyladenine glycosylase [Acidimicrobiia bacterium]MCB9402088.1 DNA-3-methyladenine glycosylase [Microthrixaceae bacterium]MCO5307362.1 DNA-3-methyladenine glycosylase [Microthrixaceae bacterium]HMY88404.1 DNA-3-methyladenine glycosylase [Microthrixaceae bacterium]